MRRPRKLAVILNGNFSPQFPEKNENLEQAIRAAGLSQKKVAFAAEMSASRLNDIVNGYIQPDNLEKQLLALILKREVGELFSEEAMNKRPAKQSLEQPLSPNDVQRSLKLKG